eukprot:1257275-Rhodomonas_salina.1
MPAASAVPQRLTSPAWTAAARLTSLTGRAWEQEGGTLGGIARGRARGWGEERVRGEERVGLCWCCLFNTLANLNAWTVRARCVW